MKCAKTLQFISCQICFLNIYILCKDIREQVVILIYMNSVLSDLHTVWKTAGFFQIRSKFRRPHNICDSLC
jgi:hypothetical protein